MTCGMKVKTSVTLEQSVVEEMDRLRRDSRSEFIEKAVMAALREVRRRMRDAEELSKLNKFASEYNREAADVMDYQAGL